jgi:SAM-dependent methyltransferase
VSRIGSLLNPFRNDSIGGKHYQVKNQRQAPSVQMNNHRGSFLVGLVERVHQTWVYDRRIRVLSDHLTRIISEGAQVLDVGAGDGALASSLMRQRPDIAVKGVDVLVRRKTLIPVDSYDGLRLPFLDLSFDSVMFIDVLHHTDDPLACLREAWRVARASIIVKDHIVSGPFSVSTLKVMDIIGNARHSVRLPFNYWTRRKWQAAFGTLGLRIATWQQHLGLYPWPASFFFDRRSLHFLVKLDKQRGH